MRTAIVTLMILAIAGSAIAVDLGNTRGPKPQSSVQYENPVQHKQGGDTIFDAYVIPGLPFNDTGTTAGYTDDYDEVCPFTGSTAPDVVYTFTPAADELVMVDLCGSSYDTKVYVYDASLVQVACNDDFYYDEECGVYVSAIEDLALSAGMTYYIVVDGYSGVDFGDYVLAVTAFIPPPPCEIEIPAGVMDEGEGVLYDGYVDNHNGGCNSDPNVFSELTVTTGECTTVWGIGGYYVDVSGGTYRDTDWYRFVAPTASTGVAFQGETYFDILLVDGDCPAPTVPDYFITGECDDFVTEYTFTTVPGNTYVVFVGMDGNAPFGYEYDYVISICGFDVVGTEDATWGGVKSLFR